ncbi:MAG: hypothetical protein EBZ22_02220, partial [Flavobacteriia bacterium]|nr:hypothetical protein [Flavobacteriia bacterium]
MHAKTKKLDFHVAAAMHCAVSAEGQPLAATATGREGYAESSYSATLQAGQSVHVLKYVGVVNSLNAAPEEVVARAEEQAQHAAA